MLSELMSEMKAKYYSVSRKESGKKLLVGRTDLEDQPN